MKKIMLASTILLLSGCQSLSCENLDTAIIGDWQIKSVMGTPIVDSPANLKFAVDGRVAGNNSCNNFFGQYGVEGNDIKLTAKGSTRMMCPESLMRQANSIDRAIPLIAVGEINMGQLELRDVTGKTVLILNKP
ncbi:heat-shock protein HslJ [Shewanella sairae]|uniref:Heat-shock protein HslJ n=2 Tax=Shewanella sairae TaxID=190310 RepID=A0ABQ4PRY1_9GAMM|nr:META domain-containing protein [Shewanella sairae]GIU52705.1 heat-shock protein HslJ [Shewanella sairae]